MFLRKVFGNIHEIAKMNRKLLTGLLERQQENPVVDQVGDVFLAWVSGIAPYVKYGANQVLSKHVINRTEDRNLPFKLFCEVCMRYSPFWTFD
jgi:hypothetical protein